jgi:hypothetical protein
MHAQTGRCKNAASENSVTATKLRQALELLPSIRTRYEERLAHCRRAWDAAQDPLAVAEAITWTYHYHQPIEPWIEEAAVRALVKVRSKAEAKRYRNSMNDLDRYTFVRDAVAGGMTWEQAKQAAAEQLGVDTETVWKSYKRVRRQFRERQNRRFRYWTLKDVRYRHLG